MSDESHDTKPLSRCRECGGGWMRSGGRWLPFCWQKCSAPERMEPLVVEASVGAHGTVRLVVDVDRSLLTAEDAAWLDGILVQMQRLSESAKSKSGEGSNTG